VSRLRQNKYKEISRQFECLVERINSDRRSSVHQAHIICEQIRNWDGQIRNLLGKDRYRRAKARVKARDGGTPYLTSDEILAYVQEFHNELLRIKHEEDSRDLPALFAIGEELASGGEKVDQWKDGYDEWVEDVYDRLRRVFGDQAGADDWERLFKPEVNFVPETDQKDREQLHAAFKTRIRWLQGKIRDMNMPLKAALDQLGQELERARTPEEKKKVAGKFMAYLEKIGPPIVGEILRQIFRGIS
jgi:hypothetical protein